MVFGFIYSLITAQLWHVQQLWSALFVQRLRIKHSNGEYHFVDNAIMELTKTFQKVLL